MAEKAGRRRPAPGNRRRPRGSHSILDIIFVVARSVVVVVLAAGIAATIFSWWTPSEFKPEAVRDEVSWRIAQVTSQAEITPTYLLPVENWEKRIGIVSGHWGYDPGAVCEDGSGLTEAQINHEVAQLVVRNLRGQGYTVDLLEEYDDRLDGYQAVALISIHADSCEYINDAATGFKVAGAASRMEGSPQDQHLVQCLIDRYSAATGLSLHPSITEDMTAYHSFEEIWPYTPAAIIEVGFMYLDRDLLVHHPDVVAQGIIDGLLCHLETPIATPTVPFVLPTEPPPGVTPDAPPAP